jgi:hypothetical protein
MKPIWLGTGVLEPEPLPVPVPVLDEYNEAPVPPPLACRSTTEERFKLKAELAPSLLKAEKALAMVPELSTETSTDAGVGAEVAR